MSRTTKSSDVPEGWCYDDTRRPNPARWKSGAIPIWIRGGLFLLSRQSKFLTGGCIRLPAGNASSPIWMDNSGVNFVKITTKKYHGEKLKFSIGAKSETPVRKSRQGIGLAKCTAAPEDTSIPAVGIAGITTAGWVATAQITLTLRN